MSACRVLPSPNICISFDVRYIAAHFYNMKEISAAADMLKRMIQSGLVCNSGKLDLSVRVAPHYLNHCFLV